MTEPILTARDRQLGPADMAHPLATRTGIDLLLHIIEADKVWRCCTKTQRALLEELCPSLVERLVVERSLTVEDMPSLLGRASRATVAAMQRRGLVDEHIRLTAVAVHTWYWKRQFGAAEAEAREAAST